MKLLQVALVASPRTGVRRRLDAAGAGAYEIRETTPAEWFAGTGAPRAECVVVPLDDVADPGREPRSTTLSFVERVVAEENALAVVAIVSGRDATRAASRAGSMACVERRSLCSSDLRRAIKDALDRHAALRRRSPSGRRSSSSAEARSSEAEPFMRRVLDNIVAFVGVLDLDGTLTWANHAPLALSDLQLDDVRGRKFWDCYWWSYSEEERNRLRDACAQATQGEVVRYDAKGGPSVTVG